MFNSIEDRALSEHLGSGLFIKKENGKYSIMLPVTGTGENGSAPAQLDKTAIGNKQATSTEGRTENPQKTIPFYAHRDNLTVLESLKGKPCDFMRVLPDLTAMKFSGKINYKLNNTDIGNLEQGEITITPSTGDVYVENCFALLEDTAVITNDIIDKIVIKASATYDINVDTNPSDATLEIVEEEADKSYATAVVSDKKVTITGVAEGSAIIRIKTTKSGYASFVRSVLVLVEPSA